MVTARKKTGTKKSSRTKKTPAAKPDKTPSKSKRNYIPWTDDQKEKLKKLFPTATREELLKAFPNRNWMAIFNQANRMGISRPHPNHVKKQEEQAKPTKTLRDHVVEFLSRARTDKEIISKFGEDGMKELPQLAKNPPDGYRVREGRNAFQEKTSYLERVLGSRAVKVKKTVFHLQHSENDPDYIAVTFPPELNFSNDPSESALRIFPIQSSFWGDHLGDRETLVKFLQYLEAKPYAFAFLLGDNIGGTDYTKETAVEIREDFKRHLAPVAHKILWAQSGPLEAKMTRVDGVDPLHAVCQELGIYHTDRPVSMDVYWKVPTKPIEWFCLHGRSHAQKDGAKLNAVINMVVSNNFPHFTVLGHLNEGIVHNLTARRLDPVELTVKEHSALAVIANGFKKHRGSEAEKKGYSPTAPGTVVGIIGADNSHKASS